MSSIQSPFSSKITAATIITNQIPRQNNNNNEDVTHKSSHTSNLTTDNLMIPEHSATNTTTPNLSFDSFWKIIGFKEIHYILSVLINVCHQLNHQHQLKAQLKDALYIIAGVRTNIYGNSNR